MENKKEVATGVFEPPVWVIEAENWYCNVPLDEYNASFDINLQAHEAATRAIEAFKGQRTDLILHLNEGANEPILGAGVLAYLKDTDKKQGVGCFVHELLANMGRYKESWEVFLVAARIVQEAKEEYQRKLEKEINRFEKAIQPFKAEEPKPTKAPKSKSPKKPRKPKQ